MVAPTFVPLAESDIPVSASAFAKSSLAGGAAQALEAPIRNVAATVVTTIASAERLQRLAVI
jgi:hypothetical protein